MFTEHLILLMLSHIAACGLGAFLWHEIGYRAGMTEGSRRARLVATEQRVKTWLRKND